MIAPAAPATITTRRHGGCVPAFLLWAGVQVIAVLAGIYDVQITGAGHRAGQWSALILLATQIGASALLPCDIVGSFRRAALAFAIAFPFTQVACADEVNRVAMAVQSSLVLASWMTGLWAWRRLLPPNRYAVCVIALWTWGSAAMWYLVAEFTMSSELAEMVAILSPLLQSLRLGRWSVLTLFAIHAFLAITALALAAAFRRWKSSAAQR